MFFGLILPTLGISKVGQYLLSYFKGCLRGDSDGFFVMKCVGRKKGLNSNFDG